MKDVLEFANLSCELSKNSNIGRRDKRKISDTSSKPPTKVNNAD
jgi:hypothetical protein